MARRIRGCLQEYAEFGVLGVRAAALGTPGWPVAPLVIPANGFDQRAALIGDIVRRPGIEKRRFHGDVYAIICGPWAWLTSEPFRNGVVIMTPLSRT